MNFLEKTLAMFKVKGVERKGEISVRMHSCDKVIKKAILSKKFEQTIPALTPSSADAAYTFMKDHDGTKELFVLTQKDGETGGTVREAVLVAKGNPEVEAYAEAKKSGTEQAALRKRFLLAAASIVCEIGKIKDPILGYTLDGELAEKFARSLDDGKVLDIHSGDDVLSEAWNVTDVKEKLQLLRDILGKDKALVPDEVLYKLSSLIAPPFERIGWRMVKHQVELKRPLDYTVYKAVTGSEVYTACLGGGTQLDGLDLSEKTQIGIIVYAIQNNRNVRKLKDGEVWKSADEMKAVCNQWRDHPEIPDHEEDGLYYGEAYRREQEKKEREKEVNSVANAVYDAQIAGLRSQLETAELNYRNQRITPLELGQIRESIKRQIEDLERKKR